MDERRPYELAALDLARARRLYLLGRPGPWYARAVDRRLGRPDPAGHGDAAVWVWAQLEFAEALDEGLLALSERRLERGPHGRLAATEALSLLAHEVDPAARAALAAALARALRPALGALSTAFGRAAELALEVGGVVRTAAEDSRAATLLLDRGEDACRELLSWATRRLGRSPRTALAWHDAVRVLRAGPTDGCLRPADDPWPALRTWRAGWGLPDDEGVHFERSRGARGFAGSWALRVDDRRGAGRRHVGVAAWPGAARWRFALQGLGRWDALSTAGDGLWLPVDPAAAELLGALYPLLLPDRLFLDRVVQARPSAGPDEVRWLALAEALWGRLGAAAVLVRDAFVRSGSLDAVRDAAADAFRRALGAPTPPEVGLLFCRPMAPPVADPRAILAAAELAEELRESFDIDWWRNPRALPRLRELASLSATSRLEALVPGGLDVEPYAAWLHAHLGG